ncbi:sensor histidine kinase [Muricoccus aerilatus]|uniref:sensor histidine kinase n=1 Tax=Muricoccus aerilatus TaxID=452982 RepID=UPI000693F25C|nr:sensor histidine kinase [Roseomonas aerilata]
MTAMLSEAEPYGRSTGRGGLGPPAWRPRWTGDLSALAAVAVATSLAMLMAGVILLNINLRRIAEARALVEVTVAVLDGARSVVVGIVDAETGQRGYLLTGEARYLQPYDTAVRRIWNDWEHLIVRVRLPEQRRRLLAVRPLIEEKLAELAETVRLRQHSLDDALQVVRTDRGIRIMDEIRTRFSEFEGVARDLLVERSRMQEERTRFTTWVALGCGALALISAALGGFMVLRRRDVRRLAEQNLSLERQVTARTAALEESNDELQAFAAAISHDLRAPARVIGGYAAALEEDAGERLAAEERGFLARIAGAAARMDGLIDDILGYSRLARQDLPLRRVALEDVVDAVLDSRREEAAAANARIELRRPMGAVRGHLSALTQAFGNLFGNALKFTAPGQRPEVLIHTEPGSPGTIRLLVEDRGIGVAPGQEERVFRPFERLHGREAYPGTGVGLAIVRRVAERLGGHCGVASRPGGGSRFWIELPAWTEEGAGDPPRRPPE